MNRIVDASVVVKWLVQEDGSDRAGQLMRHALTAPHTLVPECLNALRKKVARREISEAQARIAARLLAAAGITLESTQALAEDILALAIRLSLPTHDCVYLALARKMDGILITADARLLARCRMTDAADLSGCVHSLFDEPPMVQERPTRAYMPRRKAA